MKLLVVGGSGLIGSHLLRVAKLAGHAVVGTYRSFPMPGLQPLDCGDDRAVEVLLNSEKPDAVVFSAGWSWVDGCEDNPRRAFAENTEQPARLAQLCRERGAQFSYFSSSYVFDGRAGPYVETDVPSPINIYGRAKLEGEQRVSAAHPDALLLRVICVYGHEIQQKNFAYQVLKAMREGRPFRVALDQEGNPTYAGDIARWLLNLLARAAKGVWHLGGPWPNCTRPEWAEKLVTAFRALGVQPKPGFDVVPITTAELHQRAPRPLKCGLVSQKTQALESKPSAFQETLDGITE
jgi:dTDP-4-dehydrorhamnose reductase